eukprot:TRINITY_DN2951_c0_g1_i1.p1 TRINITY_DN2951_c0_g1~~TRINITY_DN2951_c0_g1_i1.p1  ORF type:complete len:107 (+),score=10.29 TRINITY_DN2951_c0_g1_i1:28-321(+)
MACEAIRSDLISCIQFSECIKNEPFHDCLKSNDLDLECISLRNAYTRCRQSLLDPRTRLTGHRVGDTDTAISYRYWDKYQKTGFKLPKNIEEMENDQ